MKPAFCIAATSCPRAVKYARPWPNVLTHRIGSSLPVPPVAGSLKAVARTRDEGRTVIWWYSSSVATKLSPRPFETGCSRSTKRTGNECRAPWNCFDGAVGHPPPTIAACSAHAGSVIPVRAWRSASTSWPEKP